MCACVSWRGTMDAHLTGWCGVSLVMPMLGCHGAVVVILPANMVTCSAPTLDTQSGHIISFAPTSTRYVQMGWSSSFCLDLGLPFCPQEGWLMLPRSSRCGDTFFALPIPWWVQGSVPVLCLAQAGSFFPAGSLLLAH